MNLFIDQNEDYSNFLIEKEVAINTGSHFYNIRRILIRLYTIFDLDIKKINKIKKCKPLEAQSFRLDNFKVINTNSLIYLDYIFEKNVIIVEFRFISI